MRRFIDAGPANQQLDEIVNNAVDRRQFADVTTPGTPDTEFNVEHGLGFVPLGFIVISQDKAAVTYKSTTAWDTAKIYLKTNIATVAARILVF